MYNNLDNEYHVGRIVDWRRCTAYHPPLYEDGDGPSVSKSDTVQVDDLEYYGTSPISTSEYLVRFPAGMQGRKEELLRWIILEEHSLAVGVAMVRGRSSTLKGGSPEKAAGSSDKGGGGGSWRPAMVLARSALELVTVRRYLHEDEGDGTLFAGMNAWTNRNSARRAGVDDRKNDRWALASFFGEEQHALLRLHDEARDLGLGEGAVAAGMNGNKRSSVDAPLAGGGCQD